MFSEFVSDFIVFDALNAISFSKVRIPLKLTSCSGGY